MAFAAEGHGQRGQLYTFEWPAEQGASQSAGAFEYRWRGVQYLLLIRRRPNDYFWQHPDASLHGIPTLAPNRVFEVLKSVPDPATAGRSFLLSYSSDLLVSAGWPCLAFSAHAKAQPTSNLAAFDSSGEWHGPGVGLVLTGAIAIPRGVRVSEEGSTLAQPRNLVVPLPYRPIWVGLALDTSIFAAAWFLVLGIPFLVRMVVHRWRGLCPHCAYDLSATPPNSPCPECGRFDRKRCASPSS